MTTLNDFSVTDLSTDVLAAYYNKLLGSILRGEFANSVVMTTDLTLTDGDTPIQRLNCNGANRVVKLPAAAAGNHPFFLHNTSAGTYTLTVKSNSGAITYQVVDAGRAILMIPDGNGGYKRFYSDARYAQIIGGHGQAATIAAGSTNYIVPFIPGLLAAPTTITWPTQGTMQKMNLRIAGTQPASGSLVVTLVVNAVDSACVLTIPAGSGANVYSELVTSVQINALDTIRWKLVNNASAASAQISGLTHSFYGDLA